VGRMRGKRVLGRLLDDLTVRSRCVGMQAAVCRSFPTCQGGARSRFGTGDWAECFDGILVFVVTGVLDSNQSVSSLLHQIWEKAAVAKGDEGDQ